METSTTKQKNNVDLSTCRGEHRTREEDEKSVRRVLPRESRRWFRNVNSISDSCLVWTVLRVSRFKAILWPCRMEPSTEAVVGNQMKTCDKMNDLRRSQRKPSKRSSRIRSRHRTYAQNWLDLRILIGLVAIYCLTTNHFEGHTTGSPGFFPTVSGSLIIGDSAIEIQEIDSGPNQNDNNQQQHDGQHQATSDQQQGGNLILGSTTRGPVQSLTGGQQTINQLNQQIQRQLNAESNNAIESPPSSSSSAANQLVSAGPSTGRDSVDSSRRLPSGPLPPIGSNTEDITDGDKRSRNSHDYDLNELNPNNNEREKQALSEVLSAPKPIGIDVERDDEKTIAGKVVDFELTPAGGHNKAKIKKKKKKKKMESAHEEMAKKWDKKKKFEKKAEEKKEKHHLKKKKEEGKKKKKKWGHEEHGQKKKGKFKKKKWGQKVKKGKGVKKGKEGKKFLKDKGHKNTGFKTVYHKEEWGKSSKWHDIKREKKWDEKSKKWKKKWDKEKGKKYKGQHMKKFENKKKEGKKYKKDKKEKYKKMKAEKYESGKKKKMEEHKKKKEGGAKKEEKEMKKKKKKKKP